MKQILIIVVFVALARASKLEEKYSWKELSFAWPSEEAKQEAIKSGKYVESNNLPLGLEIWKDKLFITVPRWKNGVASSLNYIRIGNDNSPVLHPYPSWEANQLPEAALDDTTTESSGGRSRRDIDVLARNNQSIVSTFRIRADECDRLWVMDSGLADILGSAKQWTPNSIAIFDLNTDKLIRRFVIPDDHVKEDSFFANIIVDTVPSNCDGAFAYMPDLGSYAVVVYDFKNDRSYRVKHNFFHFDPLQGDLTVGGVNFQWTDGVFGMALGKPSNEHGDRTVFFHALASTKEFSVPNTVLKNETYATSGSSYHAYKLLGERGPKSQSTSEFYDPHTDNIFYTQINRDAIGCWNINKPYTPENQGIVDSDSNALVFPNDLKVDRSGKIYVLSDRMPLFLYSSLKPEVNYRVLVGDASEIIKGTPCE